MRCGNEACYCSLKLFFNFYSNILSFDIGKEIKGQSSCLDLISQLICLQIESTTITTVNMWCRLVPYTDTFLGWCGRSNGGKGLNKNKYLFAFSLL